MHVRSAAIAAVLALAAPTAPADDAIRLSATAGAEYSEGEYGTDQTTRIWYFPVIAKLETERYQLKLVVPYVRITGPGNVVGAGGGQVVIPGITPRPVTTEEGLGDVVASATWFAYDNRVARFALDLTAKVKFGTASESKGLGTGENDYAAQADIYQGIGAAATLFATVGYRWYGDPPGVTLDDVFYGGAGVTVRVSQPLSVGVAYDYRPQLLSSGADVSEFTPFAVYRLSDRFKAQAYGIFGITDGSPDWGFGANVTYSF